MEKVFAVALAALLAAAGMSATAVAAPLFFTTQAAFNAAAGGGLAFENFENLNISSGLAGCAAPLNSTTGPGGPCWDVGDVIPGFTFDNNGVPRGGAELITVAAGGNGGANTSKYISTNFFVDTARVSFNPGVDAVSFDLLSLFSASTILVSVFDTGGGLLGATSVAASTSGTFFGVIDTTSEIGSILMLSASTQDEGIDNLRFGAAADVPEPATLALLALGLAGIVRSRRKSMR